MRLMFVHWVVEDRGSAQDMFNYTRSAKAMGHDVALYGGSGGSSPFPYSRDLDSADAVIFLFEWTHLFQGADNLDFMRLVRRCRASAGSWWILTASTTMRSAW